MRAGELRHRITLKSKDAVQNSHGEEVITWLTVATVWGKIETLSGAEFDDQQRAGAAVTQKITIRHRSDIVPTMQLTIDGRTLEISAVLPDNVNKQLTLMCSEAV